MYNSAAFVNSQCPITITTIRFQNFLITLNKLCPHYAITPSLTFSQPLETSIYTFCLYECAYSSVSYKWISFLREYLSFSDWFISLDIVSLGSVHAVADVRISLLVAERFSIECAEYILFIPTSSAQGFQFLHSLTNTCYFLFFFNVIAILRGAKWYLIVVSIFVSLMTNNTEQSKLSSPK